ncbi:MAG: FAD-dependent thymidylate synthase [Thaumarchaeota archaeon]|jgi:thymidylate synthase (FAD)|nr:FAD-dependent thymidylate synthase [Candidatus Geocrenenecus arthurdayi]
MFKVDDVGIRLLCYGPYTSIGGVEIDPDILIALEGLGTFKGVTIEERLKELQAKGKDPRDVASGMHRESTRRGHASLTTSLILQFEVNPCSRASTLLLAAQPFGSYLQESQRRRQVSRDEFIIPPEIHNVEKLSRLYLETIDYVWRCYKTLIDRGVPLEDARYLLPISSRTSIFVAGSLESFIWLIYSSENRDEKYFPRELKKLGESIKKLAMSISPLITSARLSFKPLHYVYPYPDLYKLEDKIIDGIIKRYSEPDHPILIDFRVTEGIEDLVGEALKNPEYMNSLNPLIHASTLEPLSIAAYHQSIRHRTVPTSVESIYKAIERVEGNPEKNIITPPTIKSREETIKIFNEAISKLLETYSTLLIEDVPPSEAIYLCPQAVRIYTIRTYNAFNLLWPQGYIGTRTCSYAQWEERMIAYSIWRSIEKISPTIGGLMGEKCKHLGYCPEKNWCQIIKKYIPEYDDEQHKKMME